MRTIVSVFSVLFVLAVMAAPAAAQPKLDPADMLADKPDAPAGERAVGWHPLLKASGTFAFNHNKDVVSIPDGVNWILGGITSGGMDYVGKGGHVWLNSMKWELSYSKTPLLEDFVKSLDNFEFESTYIYQIPKMTWWGPYANFKVKTAILPGYAIFENPTSVGKLNADGDLIGDISLPKTRINLTDAFSPAILRESIGLWADPVRHKPFTLQTRLGVGAWEVFAQEGFNPADDEATTDYFEVKQIRDSVQLGGEVRVVMKGLYKALLNYQAKAEFMYPFMSSHIPTNNDGSDMTGVELMNSEFEFLLGFKLTNWASLDYTMKTYRVPLLSPEWQLQNGLLLTVTANIMGK